MMFQSPIGWGLSCEARRARREPRAKKTFQSPIGWGLSCEGAGISLVSVLLGVSIPYWLGSKLRGPPRVHTGPHRPRFNPLLVGV